MLYIATVHHLTDKWIPLQLYYLDKYTKCKYKIFSCVPSPISKNSDRYYYCSDYEPQTTSSQNHADKLNFLAKQICAEAKDSDFLIFLDGDAFPINYYINYISKKLKRYPLIAIRRDENNGDIQPHPSFCATTVGFWKQIQGDWSPGYTWINRNGHSVTDTGGNLLEKLDGKYDWFPLLRSNKKDYHPLWYGIYGDIVYHHGAGYRQPVSRIDLEKTGLCSEQYISSQDYARTTNLHDNMFNKITEDRYFFRDLTGQDMLSSMMCYFKYNLF